MNAPYSEADARTLTRMAIREGLILTGQPCMVCGSTEDGVHHPDIWIDDALAGARMPAGAVA